MRTITVETAKAIASEWHGGQWSALYALASSGYLFPEQGKYSLIEINECLNTESISKFQKARLQKLKRFIAMQIMAGNNALSAGSKNNEQ